MKKLMMVLIILTSSIHAKNLGTFGETFAILEPDLLEQIQDRLYKLQSIGAISAHQKIIQEKTIAAINRPNRVEGLTATTVPRVFLYNPAIRVPRDLMDHKNQVFAKQGTIINPLASHSLPKPIILIDGDDQTQVDWSLKSNPANSKIILVNGAPLKLSKIYQRTFYFDQSGKIVKKFGIKQIPARVTQQNLMLQVEEILL
jgi:conjugal transfer pilus assembly protein TraW